MTALTRVEVLHIEGKVERRIQFGNPTQDESLDHSRRASERMPFSFRAHPRAGDSLSPASPFQTASE